MTTFIDCHVHPPVAECVEGPVAPFEVDIGVLTVDEGADHYRERDGRAVILGLDTASTTRHRPFSSEDVAQIVASDPATFVGFGSVDPAKGAKAVAGVHEAARLGLAGLAFDPVAQAFDPAERSTHTLWANASDHGLIVLFHTGISRLGRGLPGGGGLRLAHGDPRGVDVVASLYPDLRVVMAHNGTLWREEALAVGSHKQHVWLRPLGEPSAEYATLLDDPASMLDADRALFGSGWALGDLDEQLKEWDLADERLRQQVLYDNAAALLGFQSDS